MSRIYIGGLSNRASERDVESFFRGYGRIRDLILKSGFGFIEFDDRRDAEDAIYDLNGKEMQGVRVTLELARRDPRGRGGGGGGGRSPPRGGRAMRFSPPHQTRHRLIVENLTSRYSWQDLKDLFRDGGLDVCFADAHRVHNNEGIVCFKSASDLQKAIDKFDGKDINGREIKLVDDSRGSRSRSRSPRRDRSRSRSRRRSRSRSGSRRRSRSKSKSRDSRSKSRSKSKSRSRSASVGKDAAARKRSRSRSKSRSASKDRSRSRSASKEKESGKSRSASRERSGSPSSAKRAKMETKEEKE